MGAHSATGHGPRRTVTATAGLAAALVTTAATGLLTGGTALATGGGEGSGGHGWGHSHGHGHSSRTEAETDPASTAGSGLAAQAWCDVMGDVDLGDGYSCTSDDGSSDDAAASTATASTATASTATASTAAATTPAPANPAPTPRRTSSVPDHPTIQPIVAPPGGRAVVPIAAAG